MSDMTTAEALAAMGLSLRSAPIGPERVSYTKIRAYQTCSLQFWFRYIAREKPAFTPLPLAFGIAFHSAVENALKARMVETPFTREDLLAIFTTTLDSFHERCPIKWPDKLDRAGALALAVRMLAAWMAHPMPGKILMVEAPITATLPDGRPVIAKVDLVTDEGDYVLIGDHKTAARSWSEGDIWKARDQLELYGWLLRDQLAVHGKPIKIGWTVITKTKEPKVQVITLDLPPRAPERALAVAQVVLKAVAAEAYFPQPSTMCSGCQYKAKCTTWGTPEWEAPPPLPAPVVEEPEADVDVDPE